MMAVIITTVAVIVAAIATMHWSYLES